MNIVTPKRSYELLHTFFVDLKLSLSAKDQAWKLKFSDYDSLLYINKIFQYGHA